jgi:glucose/arabinose dehydrogenase
LALIEMAAKARGRSIGIAIGLALALALAGRSGEAADPGSRAQAIRGVAFLPVARGLESVAAVANAGDSRVFLALRSGRVVVFDRTRVLPGAFLDLSSRVSCCGDRGLLSLAFHPAYSGNGLVFLSYTDLEGRLVVARYRRAAKDSGKVDPASGVSLLTIPFPENASRYGGALAFGRDGYLYVGVGDGGWPNETTCTAQRADSLLGKILRLDVNVNTSKEPYFGIPLANPFARSGGALEKVWAKGLRDPRRLSFDRATGDLYIADTGETRQEVDLQPAMSRGGENYGWPMLEGSVCTQRRVAGCPATLPACESADLRPPILEYSADAGNCSELLGGVVYRGSRLPALAGVYFYAARSGGPGSLRGLRCRR